jgi:hypothetical protein
MVEDLSGLTYGSIITMKGPFENPKERYMVVWNSVVLLKNPDTTFSFTSPGKSNIIDGLKYHHEQGTILVEIFPEGYEHVFRSKIRK